MTAAERRKLNKNAGFSLLELLIAVVILAIIVIPLLNLFLSSNRLNIKSRQTLRATTLAQDIMEGLKAYDIEEIKTQFTPGNDFYVIDDNLIKGAIAEETAMEVDGSGNPTPGIYYFSLRDVSMQGSKFDALVKVDARGYMEGATGPEAHDNLFNDSTMSDARSIDKENGTFVETEKIRKAVLKGALEHSEIKAAMDAHGVTQQMKDDVTFNTLNQLFTTGVSRTITVNLNQSATETDEEGNPRIYMYVTDEYEFTYPDVAGPISIYGDIDSLVLVNDEPCGDVSGEEININIIYYPLYVGTEDSIVVNNNSDSKLNLLIAKQVPSAEKNPDEVLSDAQLMSKEMGYVPWIEINGKSGPMDTSKFTLKTNLGINLVGKNYLTGEGLWDDTKIFNVSNQLTQIKPAYSTVQLYTLDGVRCSLGAAPADGDITELIYDVEVSVYKEGAAGKDFPDEERMIVIEGSKNN